MSVLPPSPSSSSFSRLRRFYLGINVMLALVCAGALLVMANYLGARHSVRWFWSPHNQFVLAPQTRQVLLSLTNDVDVIVFFDPDDILFEPVTSLLKEYARVSSRLRVRHVDYYRNPGEANLVKDKYALSFPSVKDEVFFKNLVLFDCNGRLKTVTERQMSDYDLSGLLARTTREVKRTAFLGEVLFTSALVTVTENTPSKACFLTGHREHDPKSNEEGTGYAQMVALLRQNNVQVETRMLHGSSDTLADCQLLVVAGAQDQFLPEELDRLDQYLQQGGRLLVLLKPLARTGLDAMLNRWGVEVGDNLVFDEQHSYTKYDLITSNFLSHPIVRPLGRSIVHVPTPPCTVAPLAQGSTAADAAKVEVLVTTSPEATAVTTIRNGVPYRSAGDRQGSLPLAVAIEKGGLQGINASRGTTRMVVIGNDQMLANKAIFSTANMDFAAQTINWLLDRPQLMGGISPRPFKDYQLVISHSQTTILRWVLLAALPGGIMLVGFLTWLRHRR
jgi:hypothetical protein